MTELEHRAVMVLPKISYGRNTWHEPRAQTLYRYLHADPLWPLTKHEENDLWFLIWRYRRQVNDAELIARASEVVTGERVLVW